MIVISNFHDVMISLFILELLNSKQFSCGEGSINQGVLDDQIK